MEKLNPGKHWTSNSVTDFTFRIASDFLAQVETKIEKSEIKRSELAVRLDLTPGRVSQLFNAGNINLGTAVRLGYAAGMKVALVAYEDGDPENDRGPVNSEIFHQCWKYMGSPANFFELGYITAPTISFGHSNEASNGHGIAIDAKALYIQQLATTSHPRVN